MMDERIKTYIEENLNEGRTKEEIKKDLLRVGHSEEAIIEHFKFLENKNTRKIYILKYLLLIFVFISIVLSIFIFVLYTKYVNETSYDDLAAKGKKFCKDGKYEKGIKILNKAIKSDDLRARGYALLGYCYSEQRYFNEAIAAYREAVKRNSAESSYFYNLGKLYCDSSNFEIGLLNLKKSIELNSNNLDYYKGIIDCHSKAGNQEEANRYSTLLSSVNQKNITI